MKKIFLNKFWGICSADLLSGTKGSTYEGDLIWNVPFQFWTGQMCKQSGSVLKLKNSLQEDLYLCKECQKTWTNCKCKNAYYLLIEFFFVRYEGLVVSSLSLYKVSVSNYILIWSIHKRLYSFTMLGFTFYVFIFITPKTFYVFIFISPNQENVSQYVLRHLQCWL